MISSLCVYAKVNRLGFIETPYRKVTKGKAATNDSDVVYLSAEDEDSAMIAQANAPIKKDGSFENDMVKARLEGDFPIVKPEELQYMDVAPTKLRQSRLLIPFFEHDDANRALMGSNMMRQAVPLMRPNSPIVGTGVEAPVARDSRVLLRSERDGVVEYVDANEIHIRHDMDANDMLVSFESDLKVYNLTKFARTNQGTCMNLKPMVAKGQKVKEAKSSWKVTPRRKANSPSAKT